MTPCKHLDYDESKYVGCEIMTVPQYPMVRYWKRGAVWTDNGIAQPNPVNVQFCTKRGRITGIFQCYQTGEIHCYEPEGKQ